MKDKIIPRSMIIPKRWLNRRDKTPALQKITQFIQGYTSKLYQNKDLSKDNNWYLNKINSLPKIKVSLIALVKN